MEVEETVVKELSPGAMGRGSEPVIPPGSEESALPQLRLVCATRQRNRSQMTGRCPQSSSTPPSGPASLQPPHRQPCKEGIEGSRSRRSDLLAGDRQAPLRPHERPVALGPEVTLTFDLPAAPLQCQHSATGIAMEVGTTFLI